MYKVVKSSFHQGLQSPPQGCESREKRWAWEEIVMSTFSNIGRMCGENVRNKRRKGRGNWIVAKALAKSQIWARERAVYRDEVYGEWNNLREQLGCPFILARRDGDQSLEPAHARIP